MTLEIWILIIAVFAAVVFLRLGRHRYTRRQRVITLALIVALILRYVKGMPTTGNDVLLEIACLGFGVVFGFAMLAVISVDHDESSGEVWVRAGAATSFCGWSCLVHACSSPTRPPDGLIGTWGASSLTIACRSQRYRTTFES